MSELPPNPVYPDRPVVGVLAVVRRDGRVLLAERRKRPTAGRWGFPGGHQELGETVAEAALRELREETGVAAEARGTLATLDVIQRDANARVKVHYTLVAVLADWRAGEAVAADDAAAVAWLTLDEIAAGARPFLPDVELVARLALAPPR